MTSKFKFEVARSRGESDRCWPISRERNVLEISKLIGKLSTARTIMRTFQGQRLKVKVTRPTNAETESVSYLMNGKAYELQAW